MQSQAETLIKQEVQLILYVVLVLVLILVFTILYIIAFQRRKNKLLLERLEAQQKFEKELVNSQLEIQEQTLKHIGWELHDNIGQLLSVVNLQLNLVANSVPEELKESVSETKDLVSQTVQEVRSLSKTLNSEVVLNNGLGASLEVELERFKRLNFLNAEYNQSGNEQPINADDEIIIFRILQEFFSNVIKHAKAENLFVTLNYGSELLEVRCEDDGVGFNTADKSGNSGLQNMKSRAELIKADYSLQSEVGRGTELYLKYPLKTTHAP